MRQRYHANVRSIAGYRPYDAAVTAGCEALGEDKTSIRELLTRLYDTLKIRNIKLAVEVLDHHWAEDFGEEGWESLLRMCSRCVRVLLVKANGVGFHPVLILLNLSVFASEFCIRRLS